MHDFLRRPRNWVVTMLIAAAIIALVVTLLSSTKANLPQYVAPAPVEEPETPEILDLEYGVFNAENIPLSMTVPTDWTYVMQGGCPTYINRSDGARISFQITEYQPSMNNNTESVVYQDVLNAGGIWGGYSRLDPSSYIAIYELGSTDYFELTTWDLDTSVRVQFAVPSQRYDYYYDTILYLFDTFVWEKGNPIPEGYYLYYSDYGSYEFGIPIGWVATESNGISASNPVTGSILYATAYESAGDLSTVSQLDYVNAASAGRSGYLLSHYTNTGTSIVAEATYTSGGIQYALIHNMLYSQGMIYEFTFECTAENYNTDGGTYLSSLGLFRVF